MSCDGLKEKGAHYLIIGINGSLAQGFAKKILLMDKTAQITGVDARASLGSLDSKRLIYKKIKYNRTHFERLFRGNQFDYVFHLGRLSHAAPRSNVFEKANFNVAGTQRILELALKHGVKKLVLLSTFHVYGAFADNPLFIPENYPLRASFAYHDLSDVVEMDQNASSFMWRYRDEMEVVILRPCNVVGSNINNAISNYLRTPFGPLPVDYRPMFQFIHKSDLASVLQRSIKELPSGVYNVAPKDTISLEKAKKLLAIPSLPVPIFLASSLAKVTRLPWQIPLYLFEYLKHSCVIDTKDIRHFLGDDFCRYSSRQAICEVLKKEPLLLSGGKDKASHGR